MHALNEDHLLELLRRYFELCSKFGLKLHASKFEFFLTEAKFCRRIIDQSTVRHDSRRIETMISIKLLEFASDIQQLLCATNVMSTSIPDYSKSVVPPHSLMEQFYSKAIKRTKEAVCNLSLSGLWGLPIHLHSSRLRITLPKHSSLLTLRLITTLVYSLMPRKHTGHVF